MANVIITGSNSGFGFEGALAFARQGDTVFACVRDTARAQPLLKAAERQDLDIRVKTLDVTQPETFPGLIEDVAGEAGCIDVLVNNAGILRAGACEDLRESQLREVMETNFFGPLLLTRAVLPTMRAQRGGKIIMISSLSGIAGLAGDVIYSASKFALEGAAEALRHEVDRWGIQVALIECGQYATRIFEQSVSSGASLPDDYPADSPYRRFIEARLRSIATGQKDAQDPKRIGELMVKVARSDGSRLRWQADDVAQHVLHTLWGQTDEERDAFLRAAGDSNWWSAGKAGPND